MRICDLCKYNKASQFDESGRYCIPCYKKLWIEGALDAGIPLFVIEVKTKLSDHFSEEYINRYKHGLSYSCKCSDDSRSCKACVELYS